MLIRAMEEKVQRRSTEKGPSEHRLAVSLLHSGKGPGYPVRISCGSYLQDNSSASWVRSHHRSHTHPTVVNARPSRHAGYCQKMYDLSDQGHHYPNCRRLLPSGPGPILPQPLSQSLLENPPQSLAFLWPKGFKCSR